MVWGLSPLVQVSNDNFIRSSLVKDNNIQFDEIQYSNDVMFSIKTGLLSNRITCDSESIYVLAEKEGSLTKQVNFASVMMRNEVSCRAYLFMKDQLSRIKLNNTSIVNVPRRTLLNAVKSGFSFNEMLQLLAQYRECNFDFKLSLSLM